MIHRQRRNTLENTLCASALLAGLCSNGCGGLSSLDEVTPTPLDEGESASLNSGGRAYVAGTFALLLDGNRTAGFLESVEGGNVSAEVITDHSGPTPFARKHIGTPKYEDIVLDTSLAPKKPLQEWLTAFTTGNYMRKNGAVLSIDQRGAEISRMTFFDALITEIGFPQLDAGSREMRGLRIVLRPELTRSEKGGDGASRPAGMKKGWAANNFRVEIDGLPCKKVNKVDGFTIKAKAVEDDIGDSRDHVRLPGRLEFPNLKMTLAEADAGPWRDWVDSFIVRGENGDDHEKTGRIVFLAPNMTDEVLTVELHGVGIRRLASEKTDANGDTIKRISVELYVERMELAYGKGTIS